MSKKAAKQATKRARASKPKPGPGLDEPRQRTRGIDKRAAFLEAYRVLASIVEAAKVTGVDRQQHYRWLSNPDYAARFQQTKAECAQAIEDEIADRAMRGVYEPNVFQGKFVYPQEEVVTPAVIGPRGGIVEPEKREWRDVPGALPFGMYKKDSMLLVHLARAFMPERYGYRGQFELTGAQGGPIEIVQRLNAARARAAQRNKPSE